MRCKWAPCKFTPVRSAFAKFTPHRSALTPDSPPDSTQILCWSRISARSNSEIPMESPPLEASTAAGFSPPSSLFPASTSLSVSSFRPIRTSSPSSLCPLTGVFPRSNASGSRAIAFLNSFELFEFFPGTVRIPPFRAGVRWAASIVSHQPCGNHLPASTGGAQVTPRCKPQKYPSDARHHFSYAVKASSENVRPRNLWYRADASLSGLSNTRSCFRSAVLVFRRIFAYHQRCHVGHRFNRPSTTKLARTQVDRRWRNAHHFPPSGD